MLRIYALLVLLCAGPLHAARPLVLTDDRTEYSLDDHRDLLPDSPGRYAIDEIDGLASAGRFVPEPGAYPPDDTRPTALWIRFTLQNDTAQTGHWILEVKRPGYAVADLYTPEESGWGVQRSGYALPYAEAAVDHRFASFRIALEPGQSRTFYLHLAGKMGVRNFPLTIWSAEAFADHDRAELFGLGAYYGIIAVMALYNLFVYLVIRDRAYLYYVLFIAIAGLWFVCFNGLDRAYFWPDRGQGDWPYIRISTLLYYFNWIWILLFVQSFLHTERYAPRMHRVFTAFIALNALFIATTLAGYYQAIVGLTLLFLQSEWILIFAAGLIVWRQGYRPAGFYLIAWIATITGATLINLHTMGFLPGTFIILNGLQIGHLIEVVLLALALANRIRILRAEKKREEEIARQAELRAQIAEFQAQAAELQAQSVEKELETAQTLQMELMPSDSPINEGFDLAGRCLPAAQVGGDFYQYFERNGTLSICMADVTGHAMEAAVPVMMFSGVLETEMQYGHPVTQLLTQLNRLLHRKLDRRTFVCFAVGELQLETRTLHLANLGCPPLYHYQAATGQITELPSGGYPLGVKQDAEYEAVEIRLASGDRVVFCSDGLAEAANEQDEIFGFDQVAETIRQGCAADESAEALIDRLVDAVQNFADDVPQGDDMTCIALRVL